MKRYLTPGARAVAGPTGRTFLLLLVGNTLVAGGLRLLPPLLPRIIDDLGVSTGQAGIALTVMWGLYALLQYPGGRLADDVSRKTVLVGGLGLLTCGGAAVLLSRSYGELLGGVVVIGVGAAVYPPAAYAHTSEVTERERGVRFGLLGASISLGGALAALVSTATLGVSWRLGFLPVILAGPVLAAGMHVRITEPYAISRPGIALRTTVRRLFGGGRLRWLLASVVLFTFVWQAVAALLPTFLEVGRGFPPAFGAAAFGALFVASILLSPVAAAAGERVGYAAVAATLAAAGGIGLGLLLVAESLAAAGVAVCVVAAGFGPFLTVIEAYLVEIFPLASTAGDFGAARAVYVGLGSLGPGAVGVAVSHVGYTAAFAGLLCCAGVSVAVLLFQAYTY